MTQTPIEVLLTHGLPQATVPRLLEEFTRLEDVAATIARHDAAQCGTRCPWHAPHVLAGDLGPVRAAADAWLAVGWAERGVFGPRSAGDARMPPPE